MRRPTPSESLLDRRRFTLIAADWQAFHIALDAPPRNLPRLARLLAEPSVFEASHPVATGSEGRKPG